MRFAIGAFQGSFSVLALFFECALSGDELRSATSSCMVGSISVSLACCCSDAWSDWLGEAKLSALGLVCCGRRSGHALSPQPADAGSRGGADPLGTAFTFPCVTALLSRVIRRESAASTWACNKLWRRRAHHCALFFGSSFDSLRRVVALLFLVGFIVATIF